MDEVDLAPSLDLRPDRARDHRLVELHDVGLDRQPVLGRRLDDRHVANAGERHVERARDGRGGHRQHVHALAHLLDALLVRDAEPLLLVDDEQPEIPELHVLRQQPVRADDDLDLAGLQVFERLLLFTLRPEPAHHVHPDREGREAILQRLQVLERQNGGGRQERHLLAVHDGLERRAHRDLGLAVPDIPAQQAVHRRRGLHVAFDVGDGVGLIDGQLPLERVFELLLPVRVRREGVSGHGLARRIELQQLLGHVAHGLLDAGLRLLPRGSAELVERRARGAGVLLDEIEPLDRDEELVLARVAELHELLRRRADVDPLETDEHADAVVDVDDEIVDLQVAEIGEERAGGRPPPLLVRLPLFFEDVGLGPELESGLREPEPARQVPDAHEDGRGADILGALDRRRVDLVVGEQLDRALGAPRRVGDEDNRVAGLTPAADLGRPVRDTAGELERRLTGNVHGLVERQRLERRRAVEPRDGFVPADHQLGRRGDVLALADRLVVAGVDLLRQLLPLLAHVVGLRHEDSGPATRPQVVERGRRSIGCVGIGDQLLQRSDCGLIERSGRSLRGGVVGPDGFDRVADKFQTDGLARAGGIEVHDAAAHAELAGLVNRILAGIARPREQVTEIDGGDVLPRCDGDGDRGQAVGGADPREERRGGRDDELRLSRGQRVERARPRRRDVEVRREASIGVHLVRRKREDGALDLGVRAPFERGEEEPGVAGHRFHVAIGRDDQDGQASFSGRGAEERLGGSAQPRHLRRGHTQPETACRRLEQ